MVQATDATGLLALFDMKALQQLLTTLQSNDTKPSPQFSAPQVSGRVWGAVPRTCLPRPPSPQCGTLAW